MYINLYIVDFICSYIEKVPSFVHICLLGEMSFLHTGILLSGKFIPRRDSIVAHVHIYLPEKNINRACYRDGFSYFDLGGKIFWGGGAFSSKLMQLRLNSIYNSEFRYN